MNTSTKSIAEEISLQKHRISANTESKFSEQTGEQTNEQISQEYVSLAEHIAKGLTLDDAQEVEQLMNEWVESVPVSTIQEKRDFHQSFKRFQVFKSQIWEIIENRAEKSSVSVKELFRDLRKVDNMIDQAAYGYVHNLIGNFEEMVDGFEESMRKDKKMIADLSVPIIPSIVPNTILVPVVGLLTDDRFVFLREKLLYNVSEHDAESIVCDFTGAVLPDNGNFDMDDLANQIEQLTKSLSLMGVEIIYVGFSSRLVQEIVRSGVTIGAETFSTFRTGLKYLANKKKWNHDDEYLGISEEEKKEFALPSSTT